MRGQPFETIRAPLLEPVERLVVENHAALHRDLRGETWSLPRAYRWIRYEDPDPVARLIDATISLEADWAMAGSHGAALRDRVALSERSALESITAAAQKLGYRR